MIGIIVGLVSSLVIFSFYTKDQKAVKAHKERKLQEEKQKEEEKKKLQEQKEKMMNDPVAKKKRQQNQKAFQEKFMSGLDQKQKKVISDYLEKNKKQDKTDQQVMKQASNQAMLFSAFMFIVIVTLICAILILSGIEFGQVYEGVFKFLEQFFPKIRAARSATSSEL